MTKEEKKPAIPEQVEGARQAWRVTAMMQLLLAAVATVTYWLHPEMLMSPSTAKENFPGFSEGQIDAAMKASIVIRSGALHRVLRHHRANAQGERRCSHRAGYRLTLPGTVGADVLLLFYGFRIGSASIPRSYQRNCANRLCHCRGSWPGARRLEGVQGLLRSSAPLETVDSVRAEIASAGSVEAWR